MGVCKHLPWQPLGHQPPETNPIHRTRMILLLLIILPNLSAPVSIFGRIEAIAEKSGFVPRAPISYVEESPDLRLRGEREKSVDKGERKSRQIKAGPWYPVPTISEVPSSPRSATSLGMDSGSLHRRSGSRFGQASLLRSSLGPKTTSASLSIKSIRQRAPGSRVVQSSLLRASLSPGTTSASLSIKDKLSNAPSSFLRSPLGRSSGSRVGKPSLLRSSLSSSTSSATLKIDQKLSY